MTVSNSVMLRWRFSFASWLLVAFDTFATARLRFSAIKPSSFEALTSARARLSPAANRSENSVSCCTGLISPLPSCHARNSAPATASASAIITAPLAPAGNAPKSKIDAPPDCRPALYAKPSTASRTTVFARTSVQILELSRDFMPSSKSSFGGRFKIRRKSNAWSRKHFEQFPQVDQQRQSIFVAQHADAMRDVLGRLLQQILERDRIRADDFVGGNADAQIVVRRITGQGSDNDVLRQQPRTTAFGQCDIDERHDRAAQIENPKQIRGRERHLRQQRPVEHFLDVEHRQAESFATAAEHAKLRFGRALFERTKRFQQISRVCVGG